MNEQKYQKQVIMQLKLLHESRRIFYSSKYSQSGLLGSLFSFPMQIPCNRILSCL